MISQGRHTTHSPLLPILGLLAGLVTIGIPGLLPTEWSRPPLLAMSDEPPLGPGEPYRVTHIGPIGPSPARVDLVIVGEGYTAADYHRGKQWQIDTQRLVTGFFEKPPFRQYRDSFNVFLVESISEDSGADDSPDVDVKRTVFDACFGADGIDRLLVVRNENAVLRAARLAPEVDIIIVLVNDRRDGGSGGEIGGLPGPVCSTAPNAFLIAIHELGHSFADLGDEYVDETVADNYSLPDDGDFDEPNLTLAALVDTSSRQRLIETLKWGYFLEEPGAAKRYGPGLLRGRLLPAEGHLPPGADLHHGGRVRERDVLLRLQRGDRVADRGVLRKEPRRWTGGRAAATPRGAPAGRPPP